MCDKVTGQCLFFFSLELGHNRHWPLGALCYLSTMRPPCSFPRCQDNKFLWSSCSWWHLRQSRPREWQDIQGTPHATAYLLLSHACMVKGCSIIQTKGRFVKNLQIVQSVHECEAVWYCRVFSIKPPKCWKPLWSWFLQGEELFMRYWLRHREARAHFKALLIIPGIYIYFYRHFLFGDRAYSSGWLWTHSPG